MFWLYEEELPAGVGSEAFGAGHLMYLAFFLALTLCCAHVYKKLDSGRRKRADRILSAAVFFFALCAYGITALLGHFSRYALPLHVCSLMFFLAPVHARTAGARPGSFAEKLHGFLGAALFHPGLLGALSALLFPDWLDCPFWHYLSISAFLAHGLLLVYGASLLVGIAEAKDQRGLFLRDLKSSALFLSVGALVMFFFDRATGTNYWFMAGPSSGSPFTGIYARSGYGGYLLAYILTALAVTALWYGLRYALFVCGRGTAKLK
ncbi:MAG: YwaF family protein [Oscillospiraceae bacterium]|nr:YwaF family protein [Oscillospiraceae bacterium]